MKLICNSQTVVSSKVKMRRACWNVLSIFFVVFQIHCSLSVVFADLNPSNDSRNLHVKLKVNLIDFLISNPLVKSVIGVEEVFQDSDIAFLCDKDIPNLNRSSEVTLVKKYPGILLCMGLAHVLLLNGMVHVQNSSSVLPQSKSDLDKLISNMNENRTLKDLMCKQHRVSVPMYKSGLEEYAKLLNPLLEQEDMCMKMCLTYQQSINPICVLILEANSVFNEGVKPSAGDEMTKPVMSVQAAEQNSNDVVRKANTKEVTGDVSVNNGRIAVALGKTNYTTVTTVVSTVLKNNTIAETQPSYKSNPSGENIDENSAENTDNADDDVEMQKQTASDVSPVVTEVKTNTSTDASKTLGSARFEGKLEADNAEDKPVDIEEDNAQEAQEEVKSKKQDTLVEDKQPPVITKEKSTTTPVMSSAKTLPEEFEINDDQVAPVPPIDTLEGENVLVNADDTFSNINDQKSLLSNEPIDSVVDIQDNTPYINAKEGLVDTDESHFFSYFMFMFVICIVMYIGFCNKRKILALALEGRGGRRPRNRRGTYARVSTHYDESKEHLLY